MQKWVIEITVDNTWIEDGFNITDDNVQDRVREWLPYATGTEVQAKVLKCPSVKVISKLQGE